VGEGIIIPVRVEGSDGTITLEQLAKRLKEVGDAADTAGKKASGAFGGDLINKLTNIAAGYLSVRTAINFVIGSFKAQAEQEDAVNKLNLALANQGNFTEAASKALIDYAGALQDTTKFSDDAVISAEGLLASFGLTEAQIKRTTGAAADFAAATGQDLTSAAQLLGKASVGSTAALQKMGFQFAQGATNAEKFDAALKQVEQRFGGAATTQATTFTGAVAQLKNQFGEVQEAAGRFFAAVLGGQSPLSGLIEFTKAAAKFIGGDLIIAFSEARAQFALFVGFIADKAAEALDILAKLPASLGGDTFKQAAETARAVAEGQRTLAVELRQTGDEAARSAGNFAKVTNAIAPVKPLSDAAAKALEEVAKAARTLTGTLDPKAFATTLAAITKIGDAGKIAIDQLEGLATTLIKARDAGEKLPPIADKIIARFEAQREANQAIVETALAWEEAGRATQAYLDLTGQLGTAGGSDFAQLRDDVEALGDANLVAVERVQELAETFIKARDQGEQLGPVAEGIVRRFEGMREVAQNIEDTDKALVEAGSHVGDADAAFKELGETMKALDSLFSVLGISADSFIGRLVTGLSALPSAFKSITSGLGKLKEVLSGGLSFTSILGGIGAAGQIIGAGLTIGKSILGLFKSDPIKKAQKEAGKILGTGITSETAKVIKEQADKLGISIKNSALLALPKVMEESGKAASTFARQTEQLMHAIATGAVPAEEGIAAVGQSFTKIADEALKAGKVGDATMRGLIKRSRELGLESPDIKAFVGGQLDSAVAGINKFVSGLEKVTEGAFGTLGADAATIFGATFNALVSERGLTGAVTALGDTFDKLKEKLTSTLGAEQAAQLLSPFAAAFDLLGNETLKPIVEGIDGLGQTLAGLANSDFLDVNTFRAITRASATLFDQLIAGGTDTHTALLAIAPTIQTAITAAENFGIPLDENTQRLKDLAEQNGITFKTDPQAAMLDVLTAIAEVLGAEIPESARRAQQAMADLAATTPSQIDVTGGAAPGGVPEAGGTLGGLPPGAQTGRTTNNTINLTVNQNPLQSAEGQAQATQFVLRTVERAVANLETTLAG